MLTACAAARASEFMLPAAAATADACAIASVSLRLAASAMALAAAAVSPRAVAAVMRTWNPDVDTSKRAPIRTCDCLSRRTDI